MGGLPRELMRGGSYGDVRNRGELGAARKGQKWLCPQLG